MKITYWKDSKGNIYKYYGNSKPFSGSWTETTEREYIKSLQIAWSNYTRK